MTKIKEYTDIQQSKRLAKILPKDSADMYWEYDNFQKFHRIELFEIGFPKTLTINDIPAWSLAALIAVLPSVFYPVGGHETILTLGNFTDKWCVCYFDPTGMQQGPEVTASNLVDACVEMIITLHDKQLL